jgi:hypothetical protein
MGGLFFVGFSVITSRNTFAGFQNIAAEMSDNAA